MPSAVKTLFVLGTCAQGAWAASPTPATTASASGACPDDPELDLCDTTEDTSGAVSLHAPGASSLGLMIFAALGANDVKSGALAVLLASVLPKAMGAATTTDSTSAAGGTCAHAKAVYKDGECCGNPDSTVPFQMRPNPTKRMTGTNPCANKKALTQPALDNKACFHNGVRQAIEQSGADVTLGFKGTLDTNITPITTHYFKTTLCPVNVHWHLGAEHRSEGQFDEKGTSPANHLLPEDENPEDTRRRLAAARYGFACTKYNDKEYRFNNEYDWKFCKDMHVGETYEVHWPHSALGACGTPNQYQDPFYDGVFCGLPDTATLLTLQPQDIASAVGVQGQVFTIVNDESYYYPDLIRGMIVDDENGMGVDVAVYSGSTTGTTRNNEICSSYSPITWQVDRKCHLISASSFDKMCADMLQQRDDMSGDIHPHGARILVFTNLTADNQGTVDKPAVAR